MTQNLNLEIVTPQKVLLKTEAEYVTLPGEIGELGILPGHIPVLTNLKSGVLTYKTGGNDKKVAVHFGYAEVCKDSITVLANVAELAEEIDVDRAKKSQDSAEQELSEALKAVDKLELVASLQQKVKKSETRISTAAK